MGVSENEPIPLHDYLNRENDENLMDLGGTLCSDKAIGIANMVWYLVT